MSLDRGPPPPPPTVLQPSAEVIAAHQKNQQESRAQLMEAANKAAVEIRESLQKKGVEPHPEQSAELKPRPPQMAMGVVIHWSGIRGFGILRSQVHGEVFVHAKSLANCQELNVGDVVTFELGYDAKKQKAEAINCNKAGAGGYKPPPSAAGGLDAGSPGPRSLPFSGDAAVSSGPTSGPPVEDVGPPPSAGGSFDNSLLAGAAASAALKLLSQGLGGKAGRAAATAEAERGSSSSASPSRKRKRASHSRSRSARRRR